MLDPNHHMLTTDRLILTLALPKWLYVTANIKNYIRQASTLSVLLADPANKQFISQSYDQKPDYSAALKRTKVWLEIESVIILTYNVVVVQDIGMKLTVKLSKDIVCPWKFSKMYVGELLQWI